MPAYRRLRATCAASVVAAVLLCCAASASSALTFGLTSVSNTTVPTGGTLKYVVRMTNVGTTPPDGSEVTFAATLPDGITPTSASASLGSLNCGTAAQTVTCTGTPFLQPAGYQLVNITADVAPNATGVLTAFFHVEGGGATSPADTVDPVRIADEDPPFGLDAFDGLLLDANGAAITAAARHPTLLTTSVDFNTHTDLGVFVGPNRPVEDVKDVTVDLPAGLVGSVAGLSECTASELANGTSATNPRPLCPSTSQVGVTSVRTNNGALPTFPVFNMAPPPGVPARFGANILGTTVMLDANVVRTGGRYHLQVRTSNVSQGLAINGTTFTFWGVPSDPSHDAERACPGSDAPSLTGPSCHSGAPAKAFFRTPTSCTDRAVSTTVTIDSWQHPGDFKQASFLSHEPPGYPFAPQDWGPETGIDSCDAVPFDPVLIAQPLSGAKAGSPAAFAFDVTIPQDDSPSSIAQSDLRKAVVTLPQGVRVNPSSADGLGACTSTQIALDTTELPRCPDSSRLGTVVIDTPLIDEQVTGDIYLATPFDNPFKSLVAVYIVASARGVVIKLPGSVSLDQKTGQITTTFDDNPQLPFSRLHVEFLGGARAALVTPRRCGTLTTHAVLTGWNGRTVEQDSSFSLSENAKGRPCPAQFSPSFSAGTESNSAGSSSSFLMRFSRQDEDQDLSALTVHLPEGLTGKIANADLCGDAQAGTDRCPANSKIGDVTVGAGAGSNPFFIQSGKAYLTGPYKGAPFGVAIVVPAVAGPFDLGKVTVRSALFVDKHDSTVRIVSDPFPTILQGIPLDVRDVRVDVNKPRFILNPTSCAVKRITGTLTSTEGAKANVSERFQAAECASLGFKPKMVMRVGGSGHTRAGQTSAFMTRLTMPQRDQTNLRFVRVTLPKTINARLNTINDACTRAEFESSITKCSHAKAGTAVASTPLLRAPLRGTVFFVKNGHAIPDLFVALRGQVAFDLIGRISIVNNTLLRTTFATAPDVPIRSFTLRLLGGPSTASIGAVRNLCSPSSRREKAQVDYIAQNGKVRQVQQALQVGGCGRGSHRRHRRR
jgi:uncharacterized repeat protein (TIGR01451 family)